MGADEPRVERYRTMRRIRRFEETVLEYSALGKVLGALHTCIGQEAAEVGVCAALRPDDYVTSTHRGHGHAIARGLPLDRLMAELFGKATGLCHGKGGSMHIADFSRGMLGANGVVAAGMALAAGAAWSAQMRGSGQVAVCFFGEGASNRGPFHEALNLAAVWDLPVLYVCENNGYGQFTPQAKAMRVADVAARAGAYGIPGRVVDGNDVEAVHAVTAEVVEEVRGGDGPALLECKTYRLRGHSLSDTEYYRPRDEVAAAWARDPLGLARRRLVADRLLDEAAAARIDADVEAEIRAALAFAEASPFPDPATDLDSDVFAGDAEGVA